MRLGLKNKTSFMPKKTGPIPKVPSVLLKALKTHTGMMQVSGQGEANPCDLLGMISTAIINTKHGTLSPEHIYKKLKEEEREGMQKYR